NGVNTPTPSFTVPKLEEEDDTTFEFTLTVIDDEGAEDKDKAQVKVDAPLSQPQLLSPVEQQQLLSDEQQNRQVQHEKEEEEVDEERDLGDEEVDEERDLGDEEREEDENNDVTDIGLPPPSSHIIQVPDIIDLFS
ncbi:MAG TPA: hypothetical protein VKA95_16025, partial [Nitrososphaeraceae archaeon]|nr:hypothetical protein [Nitrososphaeraceae archaeon]